MKRASPVAQMVKNPPAMQETWVRFLGWEDPLEKGKATHSSILAWRTPRTEEPGGLQSMGSQSQTRPSDLKKKKEFNREAFRTFNAWPLFVGSSLVINLFTCYRSIQTFYFFLSVFVAFIFLRIFPNHLAYIIYRDTIVHSTSFQIHFLFL